jgi:hypothetical protein
MVSTNPDAFTAGGTGDGANDAYAGGRNGAPDGPDKGGYHVPDKGGYDGIKGKKQYSVSSEVLQFVFKVWNPSENRKRK